jgi:magnesium-transporting ATPase (P-type)
VFSINPFANRYLLISVVAAFALQMLAIYHPTLQFVLETEPLPLQTLLWIFLLSSTILLVEVEKYLRKFSQK